MKDQQNLLPIPAIFSMSCKMYDNWSDAPLSGHERSTGILEKVEYWHTEKAHFWSIEEGM